MFVDKESGFKVKRYLQNLRWSANIKVLPIIVIAIFLTGCSHSKSMIMKFREIQLTNDATGTPFIILRPFPKMTNGLFMIPVMMIPKLQKPIKLKW